MQMPFGGDISRSSQTQLSAAEAASLRSFLGQWRMTSWPYYSRVKFFAERVGAAPGPYSYVIPRGTEITAFSYAVDDPMVPAGYTQNDGNATSADTNLTNRRQTTGGQSVLIHGIGIQPLPSFLHVPTGAAAGIPPNVRKVDASLLSALFEAVSVNLKLNGGENGFRLGSLGQIPGAGGLCGGSVDVSGNAGLAGEDKNLAFANNGQPNRGNWFRVPEGLVWRQQGNSDANLDVRFRVERAITIFSGGSAEAQAIGGGLDAAADNAPANVATGQNANAYPSEIGVELLVHLLGKVKGPRSRAV